MSAVNLDKMFQPKSIAVVGASETKGSVGWAVMRNLLQGGFQGEVHPVNPRHETLWNRCAYKSVSHIESPIDLAVISTPIALAP